MADRRVYTVSELTTRIRDVLEQQVVPFWVEGEISNLRVPGSGHAYFTLKDDQAQIRVVLFRNRLRRIRFEPEDGLHVLAFGSLEVYAPRGEYQMVVELMEPQGLGALQVAVEQLKARLQAEGLFDAGRKRPLPQFPRKIGIVTSPTGAGLRDLHHRLIRAMGRRLEGGRERLRLHAERRVLTDPSRPLRDGHRRLDDLAARLRGALAARRRHAGHRLALVTQRLHSSTPAVRISSGRGRLAQARGGLGAAVRRSIDRSQQRARVAAGKLDGLSPLAVLGRGYSLTRTAAGEIVRRARQVAPGDPVRVRLHEGRLDCTVVEAKEEDDRSQV